MTVFLFLKQITDMLYQFHLLDYAMVIMAVVALVYQVLLVRPQVRHHVQVADVAILVMAGILTASFIKDAGSNYGIYVKVLSAFLMYFVGRMYYERLQECSGALVASGYVIVYANLVHRIVQAITTKTNFFGITNAGGDFYYNDTDLVFGLLIALIFIGMYGRNSLVKIITIFFTIPVLVLCSDAGVQKALFIAIYILLVIYCLEKLGVPRKVSNAILVTALAGLMAIIVMLLLPVFTGKQNFISNLFGDGWVSYEQLASRYESWQEAWLGIRVSQPAEKLFGISLAGSFANQYIKALSSIGVIGCLVAVIYAIDLLRRLFTIEDRKTYYILALLAILFLGSSILNNCMEFTQCSWFVMMFGGMVVSAGKRETDNE